MLRAFEYAKAGADGFFAPDLHDEKLIQRLCEHSKIPINIMIIENSLSTKRLTQLGVSRISYGPAPYLKAIDCFTNMVRNAYEMK